MVEQVKPDGDDNFFGLNQDETMRIDADMERTPETCARNSSSEEVYVCKYLYGRAIHTVRLYRMNLEI